MARRRKQRGTLSSTAKSNFAPVAQAPAEKITQNLWLHLAILALITFAVYAGTLRNGFVSDDNLQLLLNPYVTDYHFIPKLLTSDVWAFNSKMAGPSNYYRPVQMLIYMAECYFFDSHIWAWHLFNLFAHLTALLCGYFLVRTLGDPKLAFWSALWFALHPMHVEAVAWVAALPDLMCAVALLAGMLFYHRARTGKHHVRDHLLAAVVFLLGMFCKETALSFPGLLLAYELLYRRETARDLFRNAGRWVPYAGTLVIYLAMRLYSLGKFAPASGYNFRLTPGEMFLSVPTLFAQYAGKLLAPIQFNYFYVFHPTQAFGWWPLAGMSLLLALFIIVWVFRRRQPLLVFALGWLLVTLAPALSIANVGQNVFTERYLYIPSIGFCVLAGWAALWLLRTAANRNMRWAAYAALAIVLGFYSVQIVRRVPDWHDSLRLYLKTVELSPDSAQIQSDLGGAYIQTGNFAEAIEHSRRALQLDANSLSALFNVATALSGLGRPAEAVPYLRRAVTLWPDLDEGWLQLGKAYAAQHQWDDAIESYQRALSLKPGDAVARTALGLAYQGKGEMDPALAEFRRAVELDSGYPEARISLGVALSQTGHLDEAIEQLLAALRLNPKPIAASVTHYNLGLAYEAKGAWDPAAGEYRKTLELNPGFMLARQRLEMVLLRTR